MVRRFYAVLLLLLAAGSLFAQRPDVFEEIRSDDNKRAGLDGLYSFNPVALTPAPKGYEPFYISHYGRHGSRYAYSKKIFTEPMKLLEKGRAEGNLTASGESLLDTLNNHWKTMQYLIGDLTPLGWEQHQFIGRTMVASFPQVFGKGSRVDACSSPTERSIVSMASCCAAISREATLSFVYAHQGMMDVQATRPNFGRNPFAYKGPDQPFPYPLSDDDFLKARFPAYPRMLGRLFKDVDAALVDYSPAWLIYYLNLMLEGNRSIPQKDRIDLTGLMTEDELDAFWEVCNYLAYREYYKYRTPVSAILDDMLAKADARLESAECGADLRFGHDHCLLALLMVMDVDKMGYVAPTAEEMPVWFQNFRAPMAGNIQLVFYRPRKGRPGDILAKLLLNGEEMPVGTLTPVSGPYYRWEDLCAFWKSRIAQFVIKNS